MRLQDEFAASDEFILHDIQSAGELPVGDENSLVPKTILVVSKLDAPDDKFEVGTLSSAIADMVGQAESGDLPAVVYWHEVETKRALQPAVVITAVRLYK